MWAINKLIILVALFLVIIFVQPNDKGKENTWEGFSPDRAELAVSNGLDLIPEVIRISKTVPTLAPHEQTACRNDTNDAKHGLALLRGSDCATCHTKTMKLIGPSYSDIAKRYRHDHSSVARLADKIIKGGGGAWGKVPMTPHNQLTRRDAQLIVRYILTLND